MSTNKRILIVEDEMIVALDMETTLSELGHEVTMVSTTDEAVKVTEAGGIDLAIIDYHLKDGKTDAVAASLRHAGVPFIVCSGSAGLQELGEIFQGTTFLPKPFTTSGLMEALFDATSEAPHSTH